MMNFTTRRRISRVLGRYKKRAHVSLAKIVSEVPDVDNMLYVRDIDRDFQYTVYNWRVSPLPGSIVAIGEDDISPGVLQVLDLRYYPGATYPAGSSVPLHGSTHMWGEIDPVYIDTNQITNLIVYPDTGLVLKINPGMLISSSGETVYQYSGGYLDLTSNVPAADYRWVMISLSTAGTVTATNGTTKAYEQLLISDIPDVPAGECPLAAVRLHYGQTSISWTYTMSDILDLRYATRPVGDIQSEAREATAILELEFDLALTRHVVSGG